MTRWKVTGLPVTLVADTKDEATAARIEAAAAEHGLELTRFEPVPPGGRAEFIAMAGWKGTTSPEYDKLPHQYTVRGTATADKTIAPPIEWHDWFRSLIRTEGYKAPFTNPETGKTYKYIYMIFGGYKYWTFQFVINREPTDLPDDWKPQEELG